MSSSHPFWSEACISKEHWAGEFMQAGTLGRKAAEGWRAFLGPLSMVVEQRKLHQCLCTVPSTLSSKRACQPPLIDRWVFSAGSALVLWLHKDEPLFFLSPVISVPPLPLNACFLPLSYWMKGGKAWEPLSPSSTQALVSHLLNNIPLGSCSSSWLPPALFISLVCFTNQRENYFLNFYFCHGSGIWAEAEFPVCLPRRTKNKNSKRPVEFAFKIKCLLRSYLRGFQAGNKYQATVLPKNSK